jgi:hypothetical protein
MTEPHAQPVSEHERQAPSLRAADHDRDAVAEILREQHLAGRLDTDELQERIGRCYAAKTYAELDAVLADLPAEISTPGPSGLARSEGRLVARGPRGRSPVGWLPLPAFAPLLFVAIVVTHGHLALLALPLVFWFVTRRWRWRSTI